MSKKIHSFNSSKNNIGDRGEYFFKMRYFYITRYEDYGFDFQLGNKPIEVKTTTYPLRQLFIERFSDEAREALGGIFKSYSLDPESFYIIQQMVGDVIVDRIAFKTRELYFRVKELIAQGKCKNPGKILNNNKGSIYNTTGYIISLKDVEDLIIDFDEFYESSIV